MSRPPIPSPRQRPAAWWAVLVLTLALGPGVASATRALTGGDASAVPSATPGASKHAPAGSQSPAADGLALETWPVPDGAHPHDVAPAPDGKVWYTGQGNGTLGRLDPSTGDVLEVPLGRGSRPHGVIVGPDGAPWITDGGLDAIVRVEPETHEVQVFPLPADRRGGNLNTATFAGDGSLWFTGQGGIYGRLDPGTGSITVFDAPRGPGPYGIATTPEGEVWYASLRGSHIAHIDPETGAAAVVEPPTPEQGARRVWSDSAGRLWIAEWNVGQVGRYDPATGEWAEWRLPGTDPAAYAVYVDDRDIVWLTDFGANAIVRFDPATETFLSFALPGPEAAVRQLLGRPGEVWGAASALDRLLVIRAPAQDR